MPALHRILHDHSDLFTLVQVSAAGYWFNKSEISNKKKVHVVSENNYKICKLLDDRVDCRILHNHVEVFTLMQVSAPGYLCNTSKISK